MLMVTQIDKSGNQDDTKYGAKLQDCYNHSYVLILLNWKSRDSKCS